jgi:glycosyltransferase involved in cell wall biosynthesis
MSSAERTVSAIVAVRNGERYLADALSSIRAQTEPVAEIVVVDGNSTDRSVAIATAAGARVVTQSGTGIADAYNCGVAAATCDFLAFLSSDDRWTSGKIAAQWAAMQAQPALLFTHAHFLYEVEDGFEPPAQLAALVGTPQPGPIMETLMARRTAFDAVGSFDVSFHNAEDLDWLARATDIGVASQMLPEVLLHKRLHGGNLSLDITNNNAMMLRALRRSVQRKRGEANR